MRLLCCHGIRLESPGERHLVSVKLRVDVVPGSSGRPLCQYGSYDCGPFGHLHISRSSGGNLETHALQKSEPQKNSNYICVRMYFSWRCVEHIRLFSVQRSCNTR